MNVLDFNNAFTAKELERYLQSDDHDEGRVDRVRSSLASNAEAFVAYLLPSAVFSRGEARVGNLRGDPGFSLAIVTKGPKAGLWKDFGDTTQKGGDLISLYMGVQEVPFPRAIEDLSDWIGKGSRPEVSYERQRLVARAKRVERDLGPQRGEWHYTDADGVIIASVYRFEPDSGGKEFLPWDAVRRRWGNPDIRPLYNLPGILQSQRVIFCEGEKSAQALIDLGYAATTVMGGCNSPLDKSDMSALAGKEVVIWPDNDEPGRSFGAMLAMAVSSIASSVEMVKIPEDRPKGWDAADAINDGTDVGHLLVADGTSSANEAVATIFPTVDAFDFDEADIPPRPWIIPGVMLSGYTHMLAAPGGSGKSLFTLQLAIMLATGRPWGPWEARKRHKTLLINVEDDIDEQRRRLSAARVVMSPPADLLKGMIHLAREPETICVAKTDPTRKSVVATPIVETLKRYIEANDIGVLIVDPFAETFEGDENSNSEVKWAMRIWRDEIARPTGCAVYLVHHTTKHAAGKPGDADVVRGAGAIVNSTRISSTLMPMSPEDAEGLGIPASDRHLFVRFDDAKANQSLKTSGARWFQKISVQLSNGTPEAPPDEVGALRPWMPPDPFDGINLATLKRVQSAVGNGRWRENQQANEWVGHAVADAMMLDGNDPKDRKRIVTLLRKWIENDVLRIVEDEDSARRKRKFVEVGIWITE